MTMPILMHWPGDAVQIIVHKLQQRMQMWSGAFFTVMLTLLFGVEEPRNLRYVVVPFMLSSLFDLDDLDVDHRIASGGTFFQVPAILLVGVLEVCSHVCKMTKAMLDLCGKECCSHIVNLMRGSHVVAQGSIVHFVLQHGFRSGNATVGAASTLLSSIVLSLQYKYMLVPLHGSAKYQCVIFVVHVLNSCMIVWLCIAWYQGVPNDTLVRVNAIAPAALYLPSVAFVLCRPAALVAPPVVEITINQITH